METERKWNKSFIIKHGIYRFQMDVYKNGSSLNVNLKWKKQLIAYFVSMLEFHVKVDKVNKKLYMKIQRKPLIGITLGPRETYYINQIII